MTRPRLVVAAIGVLLFAVPIPGAQVLGGVPFGGPADLLLLAALAAGLVLGDVRSLGAVWCSRGCLALVGALFALKLLAAATVVDHGLLATYRTDKSTEDFELDYAYRDLGVATRVDDAIDFDDEANSFTARRFPLHWMNRYLYSEQNSLRWQPVDPADPDAPTRFAPTPRYRPQFEVTWRGFLVAPQSGRYEFHFKGGKQAELAVAEARDDGRFEGEWPAQEQLEVELTAGEAVPIEVSSRLTARAPTRARLTWLPPGGEWEVVPAAVLYSTEDDAGRATSAAVGRTLRLVAAPLEAALGIALAWALLAGAWRRPQLRPLLGLLAFAVATRLAIHFFYFALPHSGYVQRPRGDDLTYLTKAYALVHRDPFGPDRAFYLAPLFRYFLASAQLLFGEGIQTIALLQRLLGAVTSGLVLAIGTRLFSPRVGLIAGLLAAVHPFFLLYESMAFIASFGAFVLTLAIHQTLRADGAGLRRVGLAGAVFGIAVLTRPNFLLLLPFPLAFLAFARGRRPAFRPALTYAVAAVAVISIATIKNFASSGDLVPISSNGPINFLIGNHADASGEYGAAPKVDVGDEFAAALEFITGSTGAWLALLRTKAELTLGYGPMRLLWLAGGVGWLLALVRRRRGQLLLDGWLAASLLTPVAFFFDDRFVYSGLPVLFVFAAVALARPFERLAPRPRPLAIGVAWALLGAASVAFNLYATAIFNRLEPPYALGALARLAPWLV